MMALIFIGSLGVVKMYQSSTMTNLLVEQDLPQVMQLFKLQITLDKYQTDLIGHTGSENVELAKKLEQQIESYRHILVEQLDKISQNSMYDQQLIKDITVAVKNLNQLASEIIKKSSNYMKEDAAAMAHNEAKTLFSQIANHLEGLIEKIEDKINLSSHEVTQSAQSARWVIWGVILIAVVVLTSFNIYIIQYITRCLRKITDIMRQLAQGDLTGSADCNNKRSDEVGMLLSVVGETTVTLRDMISRIVSIADATSQSASHLLQSSEKSKNAIIQQKVEIDAVTLSIQEMIRASEEISNHTRLADHATDSSQEKANNGLQLVAGSIKVTQELLKQIGSSYQTVSELEVHSENIGSVLDVIKNIAEQTNLLALNAAIEAARAGESGRGFAVVADEVRTLAQRSHNSTEEIQKLINKLHSTMKATVEAMEKSQQQGKSSVEQAEVTGEALQSINDAVTIIAETNQSVLKSVAVQTKLSNDVSHNINNISKLFDVTANNALSVAQMSQSLTEQVQSLERIVSRFQL